LYKTPCTIGGVAQNFPTLPKPSECPWG